MNIEVEQKTNYGRKLYYPLSDDAKALCDLFNSTALTADQIIFFYDLGWAVDIHSKRVSVEELKKEVSKK